MRGQPADCYYALRGRAGGRGRFQTLLKATHRWGLEAEKVNRGGLRLCGSGETMLHAGWRLAAAAEGSPKNVKSANTLFPRVKLGLLLEP